MKEKIQRMKKNIAIHPGCKTGGEKLICMISFYLGNFQVESEIKGSDPIYSARDIAVLLESALEESGLSVQGMQANIL